MGGMDAHDTPRAGRTDEPVPEAGGAVPAGGGGAADKRAERTPSPAADSVPQPLPPAHATAPRSAEERRRGKRMLGSVPHSAPAAERAAHDAERAAARRDVSRVRELAETLAGLEQAHRTARAGKRRLSSFLVTHVARTASRGSAREPDAEAAALGVARAGADVPLAARRPRRAECEVYYLPRALVPEQEAALDRQEERIDGLMDDADDDWDRAREALERELVDVKTRLARRQVAWV
ncbi:hypothetical protein MSPP1_003696 [Malassezia sp. CBS 17886]|nr:hypothetical protein MSPP1_003696 [Malassezia sp. CBS 17886]